MKTLSALELLLDSARLSEIYGQEVRASRVRIKPEVALIAAVQDPQTGTELGWLRFLWPVSHSKAAKAAKLALEVGQRTRVVQVTDQLLCDTGSVSTDPALARLLANPAVPALPGDTPGEAAERHGQLGAGEAGSLLRYNPLRRVVYRCGNRVVRVQARPGVLDHRLYSLLAAHAPLPGRLDKAAPGQDGRQVSVVEYCGDHDLAACQQTAPADACLDLHRTVGQILARLHQANSQLPADVARSLANRATDPRQQAQAHARILDHLAAPLAARMRRLATHPGLEVEAPTVLSHGDASPDQVLVQARTGRLWLTDFDRVCLAPAARDLGSYLAETSADAAEAFLTGYAEAGSDLPPEQHLRAARAACLLERAADPLRRADPHWAARINERLDRIEEVLQ